MSAFGSLFASVGGKVPDKTSTVTPKLPPPQPSIPSSAPAKPSASVTAPSPAAVNLKRKAESPASSEASKSLRVVDTPVRAPVAAAPVARPRPVAVASQPAKVAKPASVPERRDPVTKVQPATQKPQDASQPKPKLTSGPTYKEMLARAAQGKKITPPSVITKKQPAMTMRERLAKEAEIRKASKLGKCKPGVLSLDKSGGDRPGTDNGRRAGAINSSNGALSSSSKQRKPGGKAGEEPVKRRRVFEKLDYQGTMRNSGNAAPSRQRDSNSASRPSSRESSDGTSRRPHGYGSSSRYRYASESDSAEDSSDMEDHGFGALEDEEEASLAAARKEDAIALREENEHRRKKLERRQQLEKLKASRQK